MITKIREHIFCGVFTKKIVQKYDVEPEYQKQQRLGIYTLI